MDRPQKAWPMIFVYLALIGVTFAIYSKVLKFEFTLYDDPQYVTSNPHVLSGLNRENLSWALTTGHASNWHPVTWLSHMLDIQLFGLKAGGHHLTNLLFHLGNSVLLLALLRRLTGSIWRSAFVAFLFALHPLHVESVAWVAERKDILSGSFFFLTLHFYVSYVSRIPLIPAGKTSSAPALQRGFLYLFYSLALVLFALGLMSKPMLVTTPFVLLLLDFWPLQRFPWPIKPQSRPVLLKLLFEKVPFFALAVASCVVTLRVQTEAMMDPTLIPLPERLANAVLSVFGYLFQTLWPAKLAVFYPYPTEVPSGQVAIGSLLLVATIASLLFLSKKHPFLPMGWFWYLGMLIPVIGVIQVGSQARADRYTYLPLIGLFIMFAWGLNAALDRFRIRRLVRATLAVGVFAALAFLTSRQLTYWQNDETLFTHATQVTKNNYVALECLGMAELRKGDYSHAMEHLHQALAASKSPAFVGNVNYYLGAGLQLQGKLLEALPFLEKAAVSPDMRPEYDYRLGLSLLETRRLPEAETALRRAVAAKPDNADFNLSLAAALQQAGRVTEAEQILKKVAAACPDLPQAQGSLADFLVLEKRPADAQHYYEAAVRLAPARLNLRLAYAEDLFIQHKLNEALREYRVAVTISPDDFEANYKLATVLGQQGNNAEALICYQRILTAHPGNITSLNDMAWILATASDAKVRNGKRAVELAEEACRLTGWKVPVLIGTLAAAYAEAGKFPEAVSTAEKARDKAKAEGQTELVETNEKLLALYRSGEPFRETK
jgi:tetratricopeptide (TPR) repeat protein